MSQAPCFSFQLYVAGDTNNSAQAIANLKAICALHIAEQPEIEVIDVFKEPERALAERIFMTPMLVKLEPRPSQRIVGVLSDFSVVVRVLGLDAGAA